MIAEQDDRAVCCRVQMLEPLELEVHVQGTCKRSKLAWPGIWSDAGHEIVKLREREHALRKLQQARRLLRAIDQLVAEGIFQPALEAAAAVASSGAVCGGAPQRCTISSRAHAEHSLRPESLDSW